MNLNLIIEIYYIGALNLYSTSYQNNKKDNVSRLLLGLRP